MQASNSFPRLPNQNAIIPPPATRTRLIAWSAILVGSRLGEIIFTYAGWHGGLVLPLAEIAVLLGLAAIARQQRLPRNLPGFVLAVAALHLAWLVIAPVVDRSAMMHSVSQQFGWAPAFFLARLVRASGAILMLFTLIGSGIGRDELLLRSGNWNVPVRSGPPECWRRPVTWRWFAVVFIAIAAVALPSYLYLTLPPQSGRFARLVPLLPWALATSALNAASEEFQYRSVLLARLRGVVGVDEALLLTAVLFGIAHYFGQPSGWGGVFLAGVAGWIWAKSMVETRGFSFAFVTHFIQDVVIFGFLVAANRG